jgi:hypothetical protein
MTAAATGPRVARYAEAVGNKIGLSDPTRCRVFGFIDGVFMYVTHAWTIGCVSPPF